MEEGRENFVASAYHGDTGASGSRSGSASGGKDDDFASASPSPPTPSPSASPPSQPAVSPATATSTAVAAPGGVGEGLTMGTGVAPHPLPSGAVGVRRAEVGMGMAAAAASVGFGEDLARKKQEKPRTSGPDGMNGDGASILGLCSPTSDLSSDQSSGAKRRRGRPPGSGRRQLLAALGEWFAYSAGGNFTPHIITVAAGEDVATRILGMSQKGPRAICILSANGSISNVTLRQPGASGGTLTFEGRFEIISLSGSFSITENGGIRSRTGGISVSLAGPDGRMVGGGVAGLLLAASPIQVVVGSFLPNVLRKQKQRPDLHSPPFSTATTASGVLMAARPLSQANPDDECKARQPQHGLGFRHGEAQNGMSNSANPNCPPFQPVRWHGWQSPAAEHKHSPDINICLSGE